MRNNVKTIKTKISILATYNDEIRISVYDEMSGVTFVEAILTHEQFVKAAMNRLAMVDVLHTEVSNLDCVGKRMVKDNLVVELPAGTTYEDREKVAAEAVIAATPEGWKPDLYFGSRGTLFTKDGKEYVKSTIRTYVEEPEAGGEGV